MKGYTKGVCFHTSANKSFGVHTRPERVAVNGHTRAAPASAPKQAQDRPMGGPGRR